MWKSLALTALLGATCAFAAAPSTADAGVRYYSGSRGTYVSVGRPYYGGYRYSSPYYGGYYSYPAYGYGYTSPYYGSYTYPSYSYGSGYSQPYYGYSQPYYGARRGAFVGPNGAAFYGPRGGFRVRY